MKHQTDYILNEIKRYGCYFCCLCEIAERMAQKKLTDAQVSEVFKSGKTTDGINGRELLFKRPGGGGEYGAVAFGKREASGADGTKADR